MNWIILIVAGFFESGFAFCLGKMKEVSGTEWYLWGAGFLVCLGLSMLLLAKAVQTLPIGTAYPVWTGIGAVGTVVMGIVFFHEPTSFLRLFFISTLIISIVGLKVVDYFDCRIESGVGIMLQEIAKNDFSHKRFMQRNGGTIFVLFSDFPYLRN